MHKNEKARNYFTCNHLSKKNLGFIDFTNTEFLESSFDDPRHSQLPSKSTSIFIDFLLGNLVSVTTYSNAQQTQNEVLHTNDFFIKLNDLISSSKVNRVHVAFDKSLTFQKYITIKSRLINFKNEYLMVDSKEYFH